MTALEPVLRVFLQLIVLFCLGKCFQRLAHCELVGFLLAGLLIGPPLANLTPFTDAFTVAGQIGLALLVLEGGTQISVQQLRSVFLSSSLVAILGVLAPIGGTFILLHLCFGKTVLASICAGTALASTSSQL